MMFRAYRVFAVALLALGFAGCTGGASPLGGVSASAQKEGGFAPERSAVDATTGDPSAPPPPGDFAAADSKPHPGGVSALPADWGGDEGKKTYDFTVSGEADPTCIEPTTQVHYLAEGNVGAVLVDGGEQVDLLHCEVLVVHFQVGSGNMARCQDVSVDENCHFSGLVSFYPDVDKPEISLFGRFFEHPKPVCGETQWLATPGQSDLPFLAAATEKLPVCGTPAIDSSILSHFKMRLPHP